MIKRSRLDLKTATYTRPTPGNFETNMFEWSGTRYTYDQLQRIREMDGKKE